MFIANYKLYFIQKKFSAKAEDSLQADKMNVNPGKLTFYLFSNQMKT